jgi:serine/threonine-protein kinase RsbW
MNHSYKATCVRDNLKLIREFVKKSLQDLVLSEIEVNQLVLAVDEVCANLIIHAHQCNPDDILQINIFQQEKQLIFEIINNDHQPFDLNTYKNPSIQKIVEERQKGGLGLLLVHKIMDVVAVNVQDETCTWRLVKHLKASEAKL